MERMIIVIISFIIGIILTVITPPRIQMDLIAGLFFACVIVFYLLWKLTKETNSNVDQINERIDLMGGKYKKMEKIDEKNLKKISNLLIYMVILVVIYLIYN